MIRKAKDHRRHQEVNLRGGVGTLDYINFMEKDEAYGTGRLFAVTTIPAGCSIGNHGHEGEFELYYILKGTAKANDNGTEVILEAGDTMICKDGESHSIENIGEGDLEYVAVILNNATKA